MNIIEYNKITLQPFSEQLQLILKDLYQEGENSDVTLVSDDNTQFKAHKFVLGAFSPKLKNIIDKNQSQNHVIDRISEP